MEKRLFSKLLLFVPILALVWGVNFYIDPAYFRTGNVVDYNNKKVASILLNKKNATNVGPMCSMDRINHFYIEGLRKAPEVIVFGSSRSMELRGYCFPGKTFFNFSISAGNLTSGRYFYNLLKEKRLIPKTVVLVADPWILQVRPYAPNPPQRHNFFKFGPGKFRFHEFLSSEAAQLVSFRYFQIIVEKMIKEGWGRHDPGQVIATDQIYNKESTILFDGSFVEPEVSLNPSLKEVNHKARNYFSQGERSQLGPTLETEDFNSFIDLLQADQVNIILVLTPYHPFVYSVLSNQEIYKITFEAEEYFKEFARSKGIKTVGAYNPLSLKLDESYFRDGNHPKEDVFQKIFTVSSAEIE